MKVRDNIMVKESSGVPYLPDAGHIPIPCYSCFAYPAAQEPVPAADNQLLLGDVGGRHVVVMIRTSCQSVGM